MTQENLLHVGSAIVHALEQNGVERVFLVPGESFLAVLDALHDSQIESIVCRQEGGASYMAEAQGKLTGNPGVAFVTRGPGAANAFIGIHAANQDATPLVLFVGMVPLSNKNKDGFQDFDIKGWFGTEAKAVLFLENEAEAFQVVNKAFFLANEGRPGPVIVALPEDVIAREFRGTPLPPFTETSVSASRSQVFEVLEKLSMAGKPLILVGGNKWDVESSRLLSQFAEKNQIPIIHDWRSADIIPFESPANGGWIGYGMSADLGQLYEECDVLLSIGAVLDDVATSDYLYRQQSRHQHLLVNSDAALRGHQASVEMHIVASPAAFVHEISSKIVTGRENREVWFHKLNQSFKEFTLIPENGDERPTAPGTARMTTVMKLLIKHLQHDAIYTFGAGHHCAWAQRFFQNNVFPSQISVRNGSMGYSVPAAVSAGLKYPARQIVSIAGDGEFLMNGQEFATAIQYQVPILVIIMDNQEFATIRSHQERQYPQRISGTQLQNPSFAEYAISFGGHGAVIDSDEIAESVIKESLAAVMEKRLPAIIHVKTDQSLRLPAP